MLRVSRLLVNQSLRWPSHGNPFTKPTAVLKINININRTIAIARRFNSNSTKNHPYIKPTKTPTNDESQKRAYEHYRKQRNNQSNRDDRNIRIASYALAAVIGALGATYASVPLYKMFCQATGFGGTTQRVTLSDWAEKNENYNIKQQQLQQQDDSNTSDNNSDGKSKISQALWEKLIKMSNVPKQMLPSSSQQPSQFSHGRGAKTWTDEEAAQRLSTLKPVENGRLIKVRFDSTIGDILPWSFVPTQLDVKVVPGETALSFFTATNHSEKAITGVATYNVHPPRAGLYFNKIQCFCFEEQRLLPGETVDMPVFFFIDPEYANDPQLARVNNITLSYTFFQTDVDDDDDNDDNNITETNKQK